MSKSEDMSKNRGETDFTKAPLRDKIGSNLKALYDEVVNEPVPEDFLNLLAKAEKKK